MLEFETVGKFLGKIIEFRGDNEELVKVIKLKQVK